MSVNNYVLSIASITYGVLQGSVLGPVLFSKNILPLGHIGHRHGVSSQGYADDTQLYLPVRPTDPGMLSSLNACLCDV